MLRNISPSLVLTWFFTIVLASQPCSITEVDVPGAQVLNVTSILRTNVSGAALPPWPAYTGISFCDVTVILTHPGENDTVTTGVWLPTDGWNGRFQVSHVETLCLLYFFNGDKLT